MHGDGAFHRNEREQSWYTLMVYLNEDFEGGNTTFFVEPELSVRRTEVTAGVKYVVRTDLMYRVPDGS